MRDKDEIICHCEEVTYQTIIKAIHGGATTIEAIGNTTKAGITCGYRIEELEEILEEELNK